MSVAGANDIESVRKIYNYVVLGARNQTYGLKTNSGSSIKRLI